MSTKNTLNCNFSHISKFYDLLGSVTFGGALKQSQNYFIDQLTYPKEVLIIGGGSGAFLTQFLKQFPHAEIDYVDISKGMIKETQKKLPIKIWQNINYLCGELSDIHKKKYDTIVTNYFLDCFNEESFQKIACELLNRLKVNGEWLFTDFIINPQSPLPHKVTVSVLYKFFQITCRLKNSQLPNFDNWFSTQALVEIKRHTFRGGLLESRIYKKLAGFSS
jgi:tRNA (cmo5U34)-methyltransferase